MSKFVRSQVAPWSDFGIGKLVKLDRVAGKGLVRYFDGPHSTRTHEVSLPTGSLRLVSLATQTRVYRMDEASSRWQVGRVLDGEGDQILVQFPNKVCVNLSANELEVRWQRPIDDLVAFLIGQVTETPRFSDARVRFTRAVT